MNPFAATCWGRYRCIPLDFFVTVLVMQSIQIKCSQAPCWCVFLAYMILHCHHLHKIYWYNKKWSSSLRCHCVRCIFSTKAKAVKSVWTVTSNTLQKRADIWVIPSDGTWCTAQRIISADCVKQQLKTWAESWNAYCLCSREQRERLKAKSLHFDSGTKVCAQKTHR